MTLHIHRRSFLKSAAAAAAAGAVAPALSQSAWAQGAYPNRPITLIVPYAPGGGTDSMARIFAKSFGQVLGQTVTVDNRPGSGGIKGMMDASRAPGDGYTLVWTPTSALGVLPAVHQKLPYDPLTSFKHVGRIVTGPLVLMVNAELPIKSVAELIQYAKANPGKMNYGSPGPGTIMHLAFERFNAMAGVNMVHVPYTGMNKAITDAMAGVVQVVMANFGFARSQNEDGPLRQIAITSLERYPLVPAMPTVSESGLTGFETMEWSGLCAPPTIEPAVFDLIVKKFHEAAAAPELREHVQKLGYITITESPDDFRNAIKKENDQWRDVAKRANIQI